LENEHYSHTGGYDEKDIERDGESLRLELGEKIRVGSVIGYGKQKKRASHKR
jgi:hypothetical protein